MKIKTSCLIIIQLLLIITLAASALNAQKRNRDIGKPIPKPTPQDLGPPAPNKGKSGAVAPAPPRPVPAQSQPVNASNINLLDRKKIIVVSNFDDIALSNKQLGFGKTIAVLLANEFIRNRKYTVLEGESREKVGDELKKSFEEGRDSNLQAKINQLASAGILVIGTITEYTLKKKKKWIIYKTQVIYTATLTLAVRLVDVNTSIALDAVTIQATAKITDDNYTTPVFGGGVGDETTVTDDVRISLFTQAANNAVKSAVEKLSPLIEDNIGSTKTDTLAQNKVPTAVGPLPAPINQISLPLTLEELLSIAQVTSGFVYINGAGKMVKVGDRFTIVRGVEIKDRKTGKVIDIDGKDIALVEVTQILSNVVKAKIVKGTGISVTDLVKPAN